MSLSEELSALPQLKPRPWLQQDRGFSSVHSDMNVQAECVRGAGGRLPAAAPTLFEGVEGRRVRVLRVALVVAHVHRQGFDICDVGPVEAERWVGVTGPVLVLAVQCSQWSSPPSRPSLHCSGRHDTGTGGFSASCSYLSTSGRLLVRSQCGSVSSMHSGMSIQSELSLMMRHNTGKVSSRPAMSSSVRVSLHTLSQYTLGSRQNNIISILLHEATLLQ